jgi:hypothetical protein
MDRWATKDHYERETEESQRLVRPAPKIKAPRRDLRRERMDPDRDPDIDDDPDIAKDKDLSLNYKNVGGSVARVLSRYLGYDPLAVGVAGRFLRQADLDRSGADDDFVAVVNKETGEPTRVKKDTLKGPEGKKYKIVEKEEGESSEEDLKGGGAKLHEMAESDPALANFIKKLKNPEEGFEEVAKANPKILLKQVYPKATFPPELKTLGDLHKAIKLVPNAPPKQTKKAPKKQAPVAEPPKQAPAPAAEKPAPEAPKEAPKQEGPAPGAEKPAPKEEAPAPAAGGEPPKPPKEPPKGGDEDEDPGSAFGGPSAEQKKQLADWLQKEGPTTPEFKEWAQKQKTVVEKDGKFLFPVKGKGRLPFDQLSIGDKLKFKAQFEDDHRAGLNLEGLKKLAEKPKMRKLLRELGNKHSDLRTKLEEEARNDNRSLDESDVSKTIKELAGVELPEHMGSVQDLIDAAEKGFAPPKEPQRSKPTTQDKQLSNQSLALTFPDDVAKEVAGLGLHHDDVNNLISYYQAAMKRPVEGARDVGNLVKTLTGGAYHLDPDSVDVPDKDSTSGEPFEDLPPEEQSEVYAKHKMKMLATSLAARARVTSALKDTGLPMSVAKRLSESMLGGGEGHDPGPNEVRSFYKDSLVTASYHEPMSKEQVDHLLKLTGSNPAARKFAVAYLQAKDYADARKQFLEKDRNHPDRQITEYDDPKTIAKKLEAASDFLKQRSARYPSDAVSEDTAMEFRNRVVDRMAALSPESVPLIRGHLDEYEVNDFNEKARAYAKGIKSFTKAFEAEEKAHRKEQGEGFNDEKTVYRSQEAPEGAHDEAVVHRLAEKGIFPPRKPTPPPGYDYVSDPKKAEAESNDFWKWFQNLYKRKAKKAAAELLTVEQRVAARHLYSSYSGCWTMGPTVRTALYWGQEPYEQTATYPGWTQAQARDFEKKDFDVILAAAREWLKVPVLGREIKGLYPDTQFRAALDLALRDHENGKYSAGLYPTVYDELLAKLAGQPGPYELSTTMPTDVPTVGVKSAVKSTYGATTERGLQTMKASQELRLFASRAAATTKDAELAFDLMALADRLAAEEAEGSKQEQAGQQQGQEGQAEQQKQAAIRVAATQINKFNSVKALVVKQAGLYPQLREVFIPILQACKG